MAKIPKTERLLNLVSFLLKSRRPVGLEEIRKSVVGYGEGGASRASVERRFERDKATLRDLGVPLEFVGADTAGGPGYLIRREAYFLPRVELAPAEAAILAAVGRLAMTGAAGPISDALASALRKLEFDSPFPGEIRQTLEEHFLFQPPEAEAHPREQAKLRELTAAVLGRHEVRFTYYALSEDRVSKRSVAPYGLGFAGGHWYLVGHDRDREAVRSFRVDRIRSEVKRFHPNAARPEFAVPQGFRIADYVGLPPWLFGKAKETSVRIRFDREVAFMVRLRPAPGDEWETEPEGTEVLTRRVTNPDALVTWVLGFGRHAEVVEPEGFRDQVIERLRRIEQLHRESSGRKGQS